MKAEIKIPAMGESITEATIGTLLKQSGSKVESDEEIVEIETDKVNQVLYAPQAGVLTLNVQQGQKVKIGDVIGFVDAEKGEGEAPSIAEKPSEKGEKEAPPISEKPILKPAEPEKEEAKPVSEGKVRSSKQEFLAEIREEHPKKIEEKPVQTKAKGEEQRETRKKLTRLRQVIAERLVEVQRSTAMLTTFNEADMSHIMELRDKYKETFLKSHDVKLGFMSFFVMAVTAALKEFPDFNSYIDGDDLVHREYYDIGVAVGTEKGLFVPVIRDCDKLSFAEVEKAIETYAKKAREGKLTLDDLQGGGFTITNGGVYGSLLSTPILNPSQCGILGMHKIQKRPVAEEDQIVVRPMMYLALSYDHRIVDGKDAVNFLVHIKNHLEDPARLQLDIP